MKKRLGVILVLAGLAMMFPAPHAQATGFGVTFCSVRSGGDQEVRLRAMAVQRVCLTGYENAAPTFPQSMTVSFDDGSLRSYKVVGFAPLNLNWDYEQLKLELAEGSATSPEFTLVLTTRVADGAPVALDGTLPGGVTIMERQFAPVSTP